MRNTIQPANSAISAFPDIGQFSASLFNLSGSDILGQFDQICEGSVFVDREAKVRWMSTKYRRLLGLTEHVEVNGKPVEEVIPNSKLREVVTTGKPQLMDIFNINSKWMVVTRLPLSDRNGRLVGSIGLVFYKELDVLKSFGQKYIQLAHSPGRTTKSGGLNRKAKYDFSDFIGTSEAVRQLKDHARRAAACDHSVLLLGETGTGKEVLAHAIHQSSLRVKHPFVCVNMAAIPESLLEAELFGVAPGAFTGADKKGRPGKIHLADSGTLFLDEIGDLPPALQCKLLRVLQEQELEAVGSNQVVNVNIRVIAATSRNLEKMVAEGSFRADLYYRLNVLPLVIPPLRKRSDDLPELCDHFLKKHAQRHGRTRQVSMRLIEAFSLYAWPGNVRELQNTLERACIFSTEPVLKPEQFPQLCIDTRKNAALERHDVIRESGEPNNQGDQAGRLEIEPLSEYMARAEKNLLRSALKACNGNKTLAAKALNISRASIYEKMARHGLV